MHYPGHKAWMLLAIAFLAELKMQDCKPCSMNHLHYGWMQLRLFQIYKQLNHTYFYNPFLQKPKQQCFYRNNLSAILYLRNMNHINIHCYWRKLMHFSSCRIDKSHAISFAINPSPKNPRAKILCPSANPSISGLITST